MTKVTYVVNQPILNFLSLYINGANFQSSFLDGEMNDFIFLFLLVKLKLKLSSLKFLVYCFQHISQLFLLFFLCLLSTLLSLNVYHYT